MHKRHKYDAIIFLALGGFAVSMFLTVSHYMGIAVPCDLTKGCELVLASKYSKLLGFPLSVWGLAYFSAVIVLGLLANQYMVFRRCLTWFLGIGALMAFGFLFLQFFVIKKVCQYCLGADLISIGIFLWDLNVEYHRPAYE